MSNVTSPNIAARLAVRERPEGSPIMYQSWGKLLFMHWPMPVEALRRLIPEPLQIDTFDGPAGVAVPPFTVWAPRPLLAPPLPRVSELHETNVRTSVHTDG